MKNCVHQPIVVANEYFEGNKMFGCRERVKKLWITAVTVIIISDKTNIM